MAKAAVIGGCAACLVHVPDLVRYGSKPRRELAGDPTLAGRLAGALRSYEAARDYPPNQTFIGRLSPEQLAALPRPWFGRTGSAGSQAVGDPFGEILDQETFLGLLKAADVLNPSLIELDRATALRLQKRLADHALLAPHAERLTGAAENGPDQLPAPDSHALPLESGDNLLGYCTGDLRAEGRDDENLSAHNLLESLCSKASGVLALHWLLTRTGIAAKEIDFLISCGEEACGDRYQRGGGGMAKAMAEMGGCVNASGMDIKNFCAAPASALVTAAALVAAGVHRRIVVVGGGSLAKLGMKFQGFLVHDMPILDDCLASVAVLVSADDGKSPVIRIDHGAVGQVPVGASFSEEEVFRHYFLKPLERLGLSCTDIDRYAMELQNPEIMEFAGSGDVARKNYRKIAAMAVLAGQLDKTGMDSFIERVGMPGFAPTQGHIPSAVPFLGHALAMLGRGEINRVMFLARASLFLNRCTNLLDGVSFILERNPAL